MTNLLTRIKRGGMRPIRRILSLDAGSRQIRILLGEAGFGRFRVIKQERIDLQEEGLVSADEVQSHLSLLIRDWGTPPLALVLPQHISTSQILDLPSAPDSEIERAIQDETLKLAGVSESRIIYDFVEAPGAPPNRQQFWVTLCQERALRERIAQAGVADEDLCEITTTANALIIAYNATHRAGAGRTILVHAGAQSTVLVILLEGRGAFASSFEMGGEFFTRALARLRNCPEETAERLKRETNLLSSPDADPKFAAAVDGWVEELGRQLQDWFKQRRGAGLDPAQFEIVASGGAFEQPGFLEHLKSRMELPVRRWADGAEARGGLPERGFEPAYGLALQALGFAARPVSLLPQDYQARWSKRLSRERIEVASLVLVFVCALMLGLGTWRHAVLAVHKKALLEKVSAGQTAADANDALSSELLSEFETFRPVFAAQQKTIDLLSSLALLQEARGTQSYWYVLLADEQSYFLAPTPEPPPGATNKTAKPSASAASSMTVRASVPTAPAGASLPGVSDAPPSRPGLIAELAIPSDPEAARVTLSQLVKDLKQKPMFAKVDLLSEDLKRNLADPKVTLPGKDFVLALDFAATNYVQPVASRRRMPFNSRPSARHPAWPANATPASSQKGMP